MRGGRGGIERRELCTINSMIDQQHCAVSPPPPLSLSLAVAVPSGPAKPVYPVIPALLVSTGVPVSSHHSESLAAVWNSSQDLHHQGHWSRRVPNLLHIHLVSQCPPQFPQFTPLPSLSPLLFPPSPLSSPLPPIPLPSTGSVSCIV